jgi:rhodanese-related sulfurtransferase
VWAGVWASAPAPDADAPSLPPPPPVVLDVREEVQFAICALPGSVNIPLARLKASGVGGVQALLQRAGATDATTPSCTP